MNPTEALQLESHEPQKAAKAAVRAMKLLSGMPCKPDQALRSLEPYQCYGRYHGVASERSDTLVSQVCGMSGDCHMLKGEVDLAAEWYRLSVRYKTDTGFPVAYARLVLDHDLRGHFRTALDSLRLSKAAWRRQSWLSRALDTYMAFAWLNRFRPSWIRNAIRNRGLLSQLESRVERNS